MLIYFLTQGKCLINAEGLICKFCRPGTNIVPFLALHAIKPLRLFLSSVVTAGMVLFLFWVSTDWTFVCWVLAPLLRATWRGIEGPKRFPELLLLPGADPSSLTTPRRHEQWQWRVAEGTRTKWGLWRMRLVWLGNGIRLGKILISISNVKRELSLPQEKGCKVVFCAPLAEDYLCPNLLWPFPMGVLHRNSK